MSFYSRLKALFKGESEAKTHSFTYFIPAPPKRHSAYREKQFDKVFFEFINQGYEILSLHTQAISAPPQAGMWVLITVRETKRLAGRNPLTEGFSFEASALEAILDDEKLELKEPDHEAMSPGPTTAPTSSDSDESEQVEGLYFIKNNKS